MTNVALLYKRVDKQDVVLLGLLKTITEEVGLHVGFAIVKHHWNGPADIPSDDDEFDLSDCEDRDSRIEKILSLDGTLVLEDIEFDPCKEAVPENLAELIENDEEPYESENIIGACVCFVCGIVVSLRGLRCYRNTESPTVVSPVVMQQLCR